MKSLVWKCLSGESQVFQLAVGLLLIGCALAVTSGCPKATTSRIQNEQTAVGKFSEAELKQTTSDREILATFTTLDNKACYGVWIDAIDVDIEFDKVYEICTTVEPHQLVWIRERKLTPGEALELEAASRGEDAPDVIGALQAQIDVLEAASRGEDAPDVIGALQAQIDVLGRQLAERAQGLSRSIDRVELQRSDTLDQTRRELTQVREHVAELRGQMAAVLSKPLPRTQQKVTDTIDDTLRNVQHFDEMAQAYRKARELYAEADRNLEKLRAVSEPAPEPTPADDVPEPEAPPVVVKPDHSVLQGHEVFPPSLYYRVRDYPQLTVDYPQGIAPATLAVDHEALRRIHEMYDGRPHALRDQLVIRVYQEDSTIFEHAVPLRSRDKLIEAILNVR